jgi:prophage regulatory protein
MCNELVKSTHKQSQPAPSAPPVDVDVLAAAIAQRIARPVPLDIELWSAKEIASYLKVGARQVSERYALMPGFPKAIRLPTVAGVRGTARWGAVEVIAWATSHREGTPTSKGGRPRKAG